MPLPLSPETLSVAYEYLLTMPPFRGWNLPDSEDVKFKVTKHKDRTAHYENRNGVHIIAMSSAYIGRHEMLISSMAHEIIHLHMRQTCWNRRNHHDAAFHKYADQICKIHEFDRLIF